MLKHLCTSLCSQLIPSTLITFWYSQAPCDICLSLGVFAHKGNYLKTKNMQSSLPELEPFSYHVDMIWGYNLDYAKINFVEGKEIHRTQRMAQKLFVRSRIFWCKPVIISVLQKQTTAFNVFFSFGNLIKPPRC